MSAAVKSSRCRRAGLILALMVELALAAFILQRVISNPVNHVGISPYSALAVFLPGVVLGAKARHTERGVGRALLGLSVLLVVGLVVLDQCNILVEYETWLKRHMPPRPF